MVMKLFDGSGSESERDEPKIEIDKEFARRYEHNKKREDLQRYEELNKRGLIPRSVRGGENEGDEDSEDSSSEDDDDDGVVSIHSKKDLKFFEALIKVRKQDPSLKSKDVKLFDSESDSDENEDDEENDEKKKTKKVVYLKDVVAKHLIEDGPDIREDDDEEEEEDRNRNDNNKLVYNDEQEKSRNDFLNAVEGDEAEEEGEEGDLLTVKAKSKADESDNEELRKKVDEYFGDESDENARFLKEYFVNKMWVDKRSDNGGCEDELEMVSEDEKEVEQQEEYEYRFQENTGDRVLGHSREVEGTVRKKVKARKEQRKNKEERMEIARMEREEELRHLKNLKKKEMDERVRKIMEIAGIGEEDVVPLSAKELEEEFDPEEYDRMMKKAFGDEYYAQLGSGDEDEDEDEDDDDDDTEKPNFDDEDELLGLPKGWDGRGTDNDEFLAARERSLKHKIENEGDEGDEDDEEEEVEEEVTEQRKRKRKKKSAILEKAKKAMLEEYYKLDYEDTIGDLKTRFKYANINASRYGLRTAEILMLDDKELNQYVPMKKIAPYKDKEWKVPNSKRYEMKVKAKELLRRGRQNERKVDRKKRKMGLDDNKPSSSGVAEEDNKAPLEEPTGEPSGLSRTVKRRKNKAELKLSQSRLLAYGKIASKPKKKGKR